MRSSTAGRDADELAGAWTYSETIEDETSTIRVLGRVDRLGLDLLRGTIDELRRRGHAHITVAFEPSATVDGSARDVLAATAELLAGDGGRLTLAWADGGPASGRKEHGPG
jgi:hypothetical protein